MTAPIPTPRSAEALGIPVLARMPWDPDAAQAIVSVPADSRELRLAPLVRAARSLADRLATDSSIGTDVRGACRGGDLNDATTQVHAGLAPGRHDRSFDEWGQRPGVVGVSVDGLLVTDLRAEVLARLSERDRELATEGRPPLSSADEQALGRQLIGEAFERRASEALRNRGAVLPVTEEDTLARAVFDALFRLNRLQRLLDDPEIENINANGADQVWVRYADGRRERVEPIAASDAELEEMLRTAAARTGIGERRFDRGSPRLSLQLPDGSRLFALMAVAARPCLSIRRHRY